MEIIEDAINYEELDKLTKRDYKTEKALLESFKYILKGYVSSEEIDGKIGRNCENGIFLVEPEQFDKIIGETNARGFFDGVSKKIVINKAEFMKSPHIAMHELGHAFLKNKATTKIEIDDIKCKYGEGLEEGALAVFQCAKSMEDYSFRTDAYIHQAICFCQLDELYKKVIAEYPNLLIHLFKEKESLCVTTRKIFDEIIKNDPSIIYDSAFAIVTSCDSMLKIGDLDLLNTYAGANNYINASYYSLVDRNYRNGIYDKNSPFFDPKNLRHVNYERLLKAIFGETDDEVFLKDAKKGINAGVEKVKSLSLSLESHE